VELIITAKEFSVDKAELQALLEKAGLKLPDGMLEDFMERFSPEEGTLNVGGVLDDEGGFPTKDVEASAADARLQRKHPVAEAREQLDEVFIRAEAQAVLSGADLERLEWIYFSSPKWTWEHLCGRAGWLLWDPEAKRQHGFILTRMN
jgi:hypothetical protein